MGRQRMDRCHCLGHCERRGGRGLREILGCLQSQVNPEQVTSTESFVVFCLVPDCATILSSDMMIPHMPLLFSFSDFFP
jgi:hypothetical protein